MRKLSLILFLGVLAVGYLDKVECQEQEVTSYMDQSENESSSNEQDEFNPFRRRDSNVESQNEGDMTDMMSPRPMTTQEMMSQEQMDNFQNSTRPVSVMLKIGVNILKDSAGESDDTRKNASLAPAPHIESMSPMSSEERLPSVALHDRLVSRVATSQQEAIVHQMQNPAHEQQLVTGFTNGRAAQPQFVAQATDGHFYTLLPIHGPSVQPPSIFDFQSQATNDQLIQLQFQAQVQAMQAAQIQRLEEQIATLTKLKTTAVPSTAVPPTAVPPVAVTEKPQKVYAFSPTPQNVPVELVNPEQLFDPRLFFHDFPAQNQFIELLRQKAEVLPSKLQTPPKFLVEQSVLPSQTFKELKGVSPGVDLNGYAAIEDTPHYTIYRVNDPREPKPHPLLSRPKQGPLLNLKAQLASSASSSNQQHEHQALTQLPVKIVPTDPTGKPETLAKKPQTVYRSTYDPESYKAIKAKLISSFTKDRLRPLGGYGPPPPPNPPSVPHSQGGKKFPPLQPVDLFDYLGGPPHGYDQKPFRPSPVDLGPLATEPLFEPVGHNQPIGESTFNLPNTIHPPKFSSKYVDIQYSPGIVLPPNEAAFAAVQAEKLGGPAFIDSGYLQSTLGFELNGKILEPFPSNQKQVYATAPSHDPAETRQHSENAPVFKNPRGQSALAKPGGGQRSSMGVRKTVPRIEVKDLTVSRREPVSAPLLAKILKATTGEEVELENYF